MDFHFPDNFAETRNTWLWLPTCKLFFENNLIHLCLVYAAFCRQFYDLRVIPLKIYATMRRASVMIDPFEFWLEIGHIQLCLICVVKYTFSVSSLSDIWNPKVLGANSHPIFEFWLVNGPIELCLICAELYRQLYVLCFTPSRNSEPQSD